MTELDRMVWVDLETSGLEKDLHARVLEVGVIVTDNFGNQLGGIKNLVHSYEWYESIARDPLVLEMHRKSGLVLDLRNEEAQYGTPDEAHEAYGPKVVSQSIRGWLEDVMKLESGRYPMVGSTINFDRFFMRSCLPELNEFFHYRNVDISTLKNVCKMLNPDLYARLERPDKKAHRPLADLEWSIKEYKFYMNEFLIWG